MYEEESVILLISRHEIENHCWSRQQLSLYGLLANFEQYAVFSLAMISIESRVPRKFWRI